MESNPPSGFDPDDVAPPLFTEQVWPVTALALDVAGRCNLACRYCAEAATLPRRSPMKMATLDAAVDFLLRNGGQAGNISFRLGSGEPLLAFPLLLRLAEHVQKQNDSGAKRSAFVFLTSNGTLIDLEVGKWLAASKWYVKISLDGPANVHDAWRVSPNGIGTFSRIAPMVSYLAERMPERLSVTAVLCRGADPEKVFEAIGALGVIRIELVPVAHHDRSIQPGMADIQLYEAFVQNYVDRYVNQCAEKPLPTLVRLEKYVARVMGYNNSRVSCGAGRSFLAVGPGGDLYPCFRFVGLENYRLGHLSGSLDRESSLSFQLGAGRPYDKRLPCVECWAAPLCGGPCFACSEMFGPGNGHPFELHCAYVLANARSAVQLVNRLRELDPERLLPFLSQIIDIE